VKKGQIIGSINLSIEPASIEILTALFDSELNYKNNLDFKKLREQLLPLLTSDNNIINLRLRQVVDAIDTYTSQLSLHNPRRELESIVNIQDKLIQRVDHHNSLESIQKNTLQLILSQLQKDSVLYNAGGISQREYEDRKLANQELYEQLLNNRIKKNEIETYVSEQELLKTELTQNYQQQEQVFRLEVEKAVDILRDDFIDISREQIIHAPGSGLLTYFPTTVSNSDVQSGQDLMTIIEKNTPTTPLAIVKLQGKNLGSIKKGMKVHIDLDAFPNREYGKVTGRLIRISEAPLDQIYEGYVALEYPLITSYDIQLEQMPIYNGTAHIVIEKINLLNRIIEEVAYIQDRLE